jgi:SAM-dependent methyltransferase
MFSPDPVQTLDEVIHIYERAFNHVRTKDQVEEKRKKGEYPYIPLNLNTFITQVETVKLLLDLDGNRDRTFIDIGCGMGTKLFVAHKLFHSYSPAKFSITGIDITKQYVKAVEDILAAQVDPFYGSSRSNLGNISVHVADGRTFDYSPFNIIYFYCPMLEREQEFKLERQIMRTAQKGAYVLANNNQTQYEDWTKAGFKQVGSYHIFKKVKRGKV